MGTYNADGSWTGVGGMSSYLRDKAAYELQQERAAASARYGITNRAEEAAEVQAAEVAKAAKDKIIASENVLAQQQVQLAKGTGEIETATAAAQEALNPWREAGTDALGQLTAKIDAGPGDYTQSPGYEARLAEGQRAIERSAAARGNVLSGAAVKAATRYGQDYATTDYDNFLSRYYDSLTPLQNLSGQGYAAANQAGAYGLQGATQIAQLGESGVNAMGNTQLYGGEAAAEGKINTSNIIAAQQAAANERDYAYQAWKAGKSF